MRLQGFWFGPSSLLDQSCLVKTIFFFVRLLATCLFSSLDLRSLGCEIVLSNFAGSLCPWHLPTVRICSGLSSCIGGWNPVLWCANPILGVHVCGVVASWLMLLDVLLRIPLMKLTRSNPQSWLVFENLLGLMVNRFLLVSWLTPQKPREASWADGLLSIIYVLLKLGCLMWTYSSSNCRSGQTSWILLSFWNKHSALVSTRPLPRCEGAHHRIRFSIKESSYFLKSKCVGVVGPVDAQIVASSFGTEAWVISNWGNIFPSLYHRLVALVAILSFFIPKLVSKVR